MKELRNNELNTRKPCPPSPRVLCRNYSETKTINQQLHPYFITGFSDAESSFMIQMIKRGDNWGVRVIFGYCLHNKDKALLERIQSYFGGVGGFSEGNNTLVYRVSSLKDLRNAIIPHFEKYPLLTQKLADFELFKRAIELINNKEHLTREGLIKILGIKASINKGLTAELNQAFPTITPVDRPSVKVVEIPDPNWLAGFTDGEGCFNVNIVKSKTHKIGAQVQLRFELAQHSRDSELMSSLIKYWACGKTTVISIKPVVRFNVVKFSEINGIIIPFFNKYPLHGNKRLDFADFVKVTKLVEDKAHLTDEGLAQIREIKAGMNINRKDSHKNEGI